MKNKEKLNEAIGNIDNKMIEAAYERQAEKKSRSGVWQIIGIAASFLFIAAFAVVLSRFAAKTVNPSASSGTDTAKEQLLYEKDFTDYYEHNIKFTSDDGTLEYELKLILPADENFFFKCYAKVTNKSDSDIQLHKIADHNSLFYLENILKSAEYEQTFVYDGNAKEDTVTLKPGASYEELLTYKDGVKAYIKSDYVQNVHDVSGYLTVTVNLDPEMSRTWGKSFTWFEGGYFKNNGSAADIVFMTPEELADVSKIHVTSLPAGYDYSFEGEGVKPITDYLASLHPVSIDDNDGYIDGMTWVIELTYADGTVKEIYHIGNTYIHKSDGNKKYYKLTYEEASRFDSIIRDYEDETTAIPDNDSITENFIEILKRDGYYYCVYDKQHKTYNTENAIINNITPDDWKEKLPGVYLFSAPTGCFIMVNDVIYLPFNTTGGYIISIGPYDYNNDGITDIKASYMWGSGISHFSVAAFDLKTMKTVILDGKSFQ